MLRAEEGLLGLLQVEQHKVAKEEVEGSDEWLFVFCKKIFSKLEVLDVFWLLLEVKDTITRPYTLHLTPLFIDGTALALALALAKKVTGANYLQRLVWLQLFFHWLQIFFFYLQLFFIGCNFFVDCNFFICFFGCNIFIGCNFFIRFNFFLWAATIFIGCKFFLIVFH